MQVIHRAETRNRCHRTAFDPHGRVDARVHRATVHDDGARAAIAGVATLFHFEMGMLAQQCAQALTGPRLTLEFVPVDVEISYGDFPTDLFEQNAADLTAPICRAERVRVIARCVTDIDPQCQLVRQGRVAQHDRAQGSPR